MSFTMQIETINYIQKVPQCLIFSPSLSLLASAEMQEQEGSGFLELEVGSPPVKGGGSSDCSSNCLFYF